MGMSDGFGSTGHEIADPREDTRMKAFFFGLVIVFATCSAALADQSTTIYNPYSHTATTYGPNGSNSTTTYNPYSHTATTYGSNGSSSTTTYNPYSHTATTYDSWKRRRSFEPLAAPEN